MRTTGGPVADDDAVTIGIEHMSYMWDFGARRIGLIRATTLIADNQSVNYATSLVMRVPMLCIGRGHRCDRKDHYDQKNWMFEQ